MLSQFFKRIVKMTQNWKTGITVAFTRKITFAFSALALTLHIYCHINIPNLHDAPIKTAPRHSCDNANSNQVDQKHSKYLENKLTKNSLESK